MKRKYFWTANLAMAIFALALLAGMGCDQPETTCQVARTSFGVKLKFKDGDDSGACGMKGGIFGLHTYYYEKDGRSDYMRPTLAIKPKEVGEYIKIAGTATNVVEDPNKNHKPFSLGDFTDAYPENDICTVSTLNPTELTLEQVLEPDTDTETDTVDTDTEPEEIQPPIDISYTWKNMNVLVTTAYTGIAFKAELTYEDKLADCKATYEAWGIMPAVSCAGTDDDGNTIPDKSLCSQFAIPEKNIWVGFNADMIDYVECDKDTLLCLLKELPPQLK